LVEKAKPITRLQSEIEDQILDLIRSHALKRGDRLPSQEELAGQLGVSRASLRESLARLVNQGIVQQVHGIGTFVAGDPSTFQSSAEVNFSLTEMIQILGMQPGTSYVKISEEDLPAQGCFEHHTSSFRPSFCLRRVRTANGQPFAFSLSYLPRNLPGLLPDESLYYGSLYVFLQEHCSQVIMDTSAVIEAQNASDEIARYLNLAPTTPILALHQEHNNQHGETVICSIDYFVQNLLFKVKRRRPDGKSG
jgi:GntR family transcriptional regulator